MKLLRRFPAMAFTLVFLSIVSLGLAQQSITLLLVSGSLAAMSWYVTEGPRGRSLPRWVSHLLVVAVALYAAAELIQGLDDVHGVLGRFGLWLTLIKLYERNTARDHGHLLLLSLLLMLVATLDASGLLFSIILIVYAMLGIYVLLLYQMYAAHERASAERRKSLATAGVISTAGAPLPPLKPIFGQHATGNFRGLVGAVGIAGFSLGVMVFIAFPRGVLENAVPGLHSHRNRLTTGFTDEVNLLTGGRISESRRSVMSVELLDQADEPMHFYEPLRLRGAVFDRYAGDGRWLRTRGLPQRFSVASHSFTAFSPIAPEPVRTLTLVVRSRAEPDAIFSLYAPVAVSADRSTELLYDRRTQLVSLCNTGAPPLTYRVRFQPVPTEAVAAHVIEDAPIRKRGGLHLLHDERVRDHALSILAEAGIAQQQPDPFYDAEGYWRWAREAARALAQSFDTPEFSYTLDLDFIIPEVDGEREDPVRHFLFEAKRGHCEYFASALVALCENLGIQSRLVVGYLASEYNELAGRYEVLERNAHAWVEVRTGERRWSAFDPTPAAVLEEITNEPASIGERFHAIYDRVDAVWSYNVLAFDAHTQQRIAEGWDLRLGERLSNGVAIVREWFLSANVAFSLGPAGSIYLACVLGILILALTVLVKLLRRSRTIRRRTRLEHLRKRGSLGFWEAEYQRMLRDAGFYLDALDALEKRGIVKPYWTPPLAFAEQLERQHPAVARVLRELTVLFYRSRYGNQPLTVEEVALVRSRISELRERGAPPESGHE